MSEVNNTNERWIIKFVSERFLFRREINGVLKRELFF